mmetsp:Transcript_9665/g.18923  ORF Transcript_9665/g.18923 Transcript_9665/m.18923 type:complete len:773 (-) Transcript_9665:10277-12595(-)
MAYKSICDILKWKSDETECIAALQSRSVQGEHDSINKGLVYGILAGEDWLRILIMCSRDQFQIACHTLKLLLPRLRDFGRCQQLLGKLMRLDSPAFTDLLIAAARSYDCVNLFKSELDWLCSHPHLANLVFYKALSQASVDAADTSMMLAEYTSIALQIWLRCRDHCIGVGRDLMRLLGNLAEIPGLEPLWNELSLNSDTSPLYWRVLSSPTNIRFHSMLLNPEVETRLVFIVEQVPIFNSGRHLKWLVDSIAEHSFPDIMRFLVYFRTSSRSTPRWRIAGWLLEQNCSPHVHASLKQALIFDVLFLNPTDSSDPEEQLDTIRPVMELMADCLDKKPELAEELLEFIMLSAELYDLRAKGYIIRNVKESFARAEAARLFPSIEELVKDERLGFEVRSRLNDFYSKPSAEPYPIEPLPLEESHIVVQQEIIDFLREAGSKFTQQPSIETLNLVLSKKPKLNEDFAGFVLKVLNSELVIPPSIDFHDKVLWQLFEAAESDPVIKELVSLCEAQNASFGVRLLIYSLKTQSKLYTFASDKLIRDMRAGLHDLSLTTLSWLFPRVFEQSSQSVSQPLLHFFFQIATPELMSQVEADLLFKKYSLFGEKLGSLLESSQDYAHTEQLYLWKLIIAEVTYEQADQLLTGFIKLGHLKNAWEAKSGFQQFFSIHGSRIDVVMTKKLLSLPSKNLAQSISLILTRVKPVVIEAAVVETLGPQSSFQVQTNLLRHLRYWQGTVLRDIVSAKSVQESLSSTLQALSSEYFKEFASLLESCRYT